jgi:hypothetical protein
VTRRPRTASETTTRWFETPAGGARLAHDEDVVRALQPGLRYETGPDGAPCLVGVVRIVTVSGIPHDIATRIEFPDGYPIDEPFAFEVGARFPHDADHHFFRDTQRVCLWLDVASRWRPDDRDALVEFLTELGTFYYRQLQMEANPGMSFPGPSFAHGWNPAYREHLAQVLRMPPGEIPRMRHALAGNVGRRAWCPCGRSRRYEHCHRGAIERFRARMRPERLANLVAELRGDSRALTPA